MAHLHQLLQDRVAAWRADGYPHADYPAIAEVLGFQRDDHGSLRFLRAPQLRALETYWYLRLIEGTPHVFELYRRLFPETTELLEALGLRGEAMMRFVLNNGLDALWDRIRSDDDFVRAHRLESVRETLSLDYPSYILALAMGAGKTILIASIIATEFALAQEYPDGPFIQNALIFAPGKTIIEALREVAEVPYERILPPRLHKPFAASVSLTFTRDGERNIPVVPGSLFNVVVTNTEKIRIQKETVRRGDLGSLFSAAGEERAREEVANLRLQTLASLPQLGIFSDEAHHTYGQSLLGRWQRDPATGERVFREAGIKKVRKTVDYLHQNTSLVCVVNTTGTPYFQKQPLRDVVIWYGLSEGIRDGILKPVADNIYGYGYAPEQADALVRDVVTSFFRDYGDVALPDGTPAKLAIYFPQTDDVQALRPVVEQVLAELGLSPTLILEHHTRHEEPDEFNRFRRPDSSKRIALLVDRGTEGWNVPALFACALLRQLKSSNNFVLQAATRCLRQVPGNTHPARIYLSKENQRILDAQLQETYGESLRELGHAHRETASRPLTLRKYRMPPLVVKQTLRTVVPKEEDGPTPTLHLERPADAAAPAATRSVFTVHESRATFRVLRQVGESVEIESATPTLDLYTAATELAATYRRDFWQIRDELARLYPDGEVPEAHLPEIGRQIEAHGAGYEVREETVEVALALVRLDPRTGTPDARGWTAQPAGADGTETTYTAQITYFKDREKLLYSLADVQGTEHGFGFHYAPYNFDSRLEADFFERMLRHLELHPEAVEDIYFTGALTDPNQTDFFVEYRDEKGKWRRYTPDFVIRLKDGRTLIVETKWGVARSHPIDGESGKKALAVREWEKLDPERLRYQMIFSDDDTVPMNDLRQAMEFVPAAGPAATEGTR